MLHYRYSLRVWSLTSIRRYTREMSLTLREKSESLIETEWKKIKKNEKREKRRRKKNVGKKAFVPMKNGPATITELGIFLHGQKQAIKK